MPDAPVVEIVREHKRLLLAREAQQQRELAQAWLEDVESRLEGQMAALAFEVEQARRSGVAVSLTTLLAMERFLELLRFLQEAVTAFNGAAESEIVQRQRENGLLAVRHALQAIQAQGVDAQIENVTPEQIETLVGLAADGSALGDLLARSWAESANGMTNQLLDIRGAPEEMRRQMRRGLAAGLLVILVIARQEPMRLYREVSRQQFEIAGLVEGYKRVATHDNRVCPACLMDDGNFYPTRESMPEHVGGRCIAVPVITGIGAPTWRPGRDWFAEQSEAAQRQILGKGRFEAWQAGQFDLDALVTVRHEPGFGDSIQATPLKNLVSGAGSSS